MIVSSLGMQTSEPKKLRNERITQPQSNEDAHSVSDVLCSKFAIVHVLVSMSTSFIIPFGFMSLICLHLADEGTRNAQYLSFILLSPFLTAILSPFLVPLSWPEANEKQSISVLSQTHFPHYIPFFRSDGLFRFAITRHLFIGMLLAVVWIPIGVLSTLITSKVSTIAYIACLSVYVSLISVCVIPLALLSFSIKPNHERVLCMMKRANQSNKCATLLCRIGYSIKC